MERWVLEGEFSPCYSQWFINQPKSSFTPLQTPLHPTEHSRGTGRAFTSIRCGGWPCRSSAQSRSSALGWDAAEQVCPGAGSPCPQPPRASSGSPLSPSSPCHHTGTWGQSLPAAESPHGGGIPLGTAEHQRRREEKSKAAPSWQPELEAKLGAWKKWQAIKLVH